MTSGPGNNVYVLKGTGTPEIVQLPGRGRTIVLTNRSLDVPPFLKTAVARGPPPVTLRGSEGNRRLFANEPAARSSPVRNRLRWRAEREATRSSSTRPMATSRLGAPAPIATASPARPKTPAATGVERPASDRPTVTDFNPAKAIACCSAPAVFGGEVLKLRRTFTVVASANPWPRLRRPTLLLDTRSGVLSFDRDGSGPISDKVIVRLPGRQGLERRAVVVGRG